MIGCETTQVGKDEWYLLVIGTCLGSTQGGQKPLGMVRIIPLNRATNMCCVS